MEMTIMTTIDGDEDYLIQPRLLFLPLPPLLAQRQPVVLVTAAEAMPRQLLAVLNKSSTTSSQIDYDDDAKDNGGV